MKAALFAFGFSLLLSASASAQPDSLIRVPSHDLYIPLPGVAVIRDSEKWTTLWDRFGIRGHRNGELVLSAPPPVDFRRYMLVAVGLGSRSGCSNNARYIEQVYQRGDSVVVDVGEADLPESGSYIQVTCAMIINPVDVVRLVRSKVPVTFRAADDRISLPHPARWWAVPTAEQLDGMDPQERSVFLGALARDPSTSVSSLLDVAERLSEHDWDIGGILIDRPEVRRNSNALLALTRVRGIAERARQMLLEVHGLDLAGDPSTPSHVLGLLLSEPGLKEADAEVVRALLRHPRVRDNQVFLGRLIPSARCHPEIWREACELYLERWPRTYVLERDSTGTPVRSARVLCPSEEPF